MPRKLNALGAHQNVHAGAIKRCTKGVGMQRLTPLVIRLLMAVPAVLRVQKGGRLKKVTALDCRVPWQRNLVLDKWKLVEGAHMVRVGLANARFYRLLIFRARFGNVFRACERPDKED